ncbi:MAG: ArsR family transcriptional regulator [Armatimonadetes bacterium]|nr:ArsR family transcriptional regulator [Armatimonadota bacterium]
MRTSTKRTANDNAEICAVRCFKEDLVAEIKGWLSEVTEIRRAAILFGALADPTRLKILAALSRGELCV